jgi:2-aminoadipate transaminase
VTQATIRRALQDLTDAGQACCHVGRGTFITEPDAATEATLPERPETSPASRPAATHHRPASPNPVELAARQLRMGVSKALRDIMSLADKPNLIHFTKGVPDPSMLPKNFLEEVATETFARHRGNPQQLIEVTDPLGSYELRVEIATRFAADGMEVTPNMVLITNGSMQGVTLLAQASLDIGWLIVCETPCFKGITDSFAAMGHWVETILRDQEGPLPHRLSQLANGSPYLLYLCPYAHNPMGTHISAERQEKIIDWARQTGSTIVADELFKDLCWGGNTPRSIIKDLGAEQTVIVSSLSKSIMTGLRIGWLISSPQRVQQLAQLKRLMDHSCASLIQAMALTIFRSGRYDSHTERMAVIYKERRDAMIAALTRHMPQEISWTKPDGGFSLLLELPQGYSSVALFLGAIGKGVAFLPGPLFDIDQRFVNAIRLSYAMSDVAEIERGIQLLAGAVDEFLRRPPGDTGLSGLGTYQ